MGVCILSIETSTKVCSVALSVDEKIVYSREEFKGPSHAAVLGSFVQEAVDYARGKQLIIHAIAVSSGPGSYTGLRIGVSEAKGLCYGMDTPLIAVPTLQIMASKMILAGQKADYYCSMIDARRMEVYAAIYDSDMQEVKPTSADIITEESYRDFLTQGKVVFFGDGAEKCSKLISSENAIFAENIYPLASDMTVLALKQYKENKFQDVAYFEPFYLKEFQATTPKKKI